MLKIPTVFRRNEEDMARVLLDPHPDCHWVLAGEGIPTRKYDSVCVMLDVDGMWWARRMVRPGKSTPDAFIALDQDPATGTTVGWEPLQNTGWPAMHSEALSNLSTQLVRGSTYELCGPKINGNHEAFKTHVLIRHGDAEIDTLYANGEPRTYDLIKGRVLTLADRGWEGIVWHHPDGRMAKLKARDFPDDRSFPAERMTQQPAQETPRA